MRDDWFHANDRREQVESLVNRAGLDGSFAVRYSKTTQGAFSLSVLYKRRVYTYLILPGNDKKFAVQTIHGVQSKRFDSVDDLVEDFKRPGNGLACTLKYPVRRQVLPFSSVPPSLPPRRNPASYAHAKPPSLSPRPSDFTRNQDQEDQRCKICFDARIDTFIEPCGHVCLCFYCAKQIEECPMCRKEITHIKKAFLT